LNTDTTAIKLSAALTGLGWVTATGAGRGRAGETPFWAAGEPQPPKTVLKFLSGGSRFGRLDLFSQIGVAAVALALADAGRLDDLIAPKTDRNHELALICATTSSCRRTDHNFYKTVLDNPRLASPGLFVYTLATSFLGEAALRFALTGSSLALIEPQPGGGDALRLGLEQLTFGDEDIIIVGICNLFDKTESVAPFFPGALFLVLEKEQNRHAQSYATIICDPKGKGFYSNDQPCSDILSLSAIICKNSTQDF